MIEPSFVFKIFRLLWCYITLYQKVLHGMCGDLLIEKGDQQEKKYKRRDVCSVRWMGCRRGTFCFGRLGGANLHLFYHPTL